MLTDLILLAGGEVRRGWDAFKAAGLDQKLIERYYGGALLVGISAGAVQLGLKGWDEAGERISDMLRVVPFVVDVHDEPGWGHLLQAVPRAGEHARGIGIPSGGGALYHPDYSVEPVRHPLVEVSQAENGLQQALLLPGQASAAAAEPGRPGAEEPAGQAGAGEPAGEPGAAAASAEPPGVPSDPEGARGGRSDWGDRGDRADRRQDLERERKDLGYSIGADGVIELHPPEDPTKEPVN